MKSTEELKKEQYDLKAKLHEVIEFINSEEYFTLSSRVKGLIGQQRVGMEMYLNALTNRIYCEESYSFDVSSTIWPMMLGSMFSSSSFSTTPSKATDMLKESDFETKEKQDE